MPKNTSLLCFYAFNSFFHLTLVLHIYIWDYVCLVYFNVLIHSSINESWYYFYILAITIMTAINVEYRFQFEKLFWSPLSIDLAVRSLDHTVFFLSLQGKTILYSVLADLFIFPPVAYRSSLFARALPTMIVYIYCNSQVNKRKVSLLCFPL